MGTDRGIRDPVVCRKISQRNKFIKCITRFSLWDTHIMFLLAHTSSWESVREETVAGLREK